jgi:hypothetical protein
VTVSTQALNLALVVTPQNGGSGEVGIQWLFRGAMAQKSVLQIVNIKGDAGAYQGMN